MRLKSDASSSPQQLTDKAFAMISLGCVVSGAIAAFWLLGSPSQQRLISFDRQRLTDLRAIAFRLTDGAMNSNNAPEPLPEELPQDANYRGYAGELTQDPVTQAPYEYERVSDTEYKLCATFSTSSQDRRLEQTDLAKEWQHPAGRHCFELDTTEPVPDMPYYRGIR